MKGAEAQGENLQLVSSDSPLRPEKPSRCRLQSSRTSTQSSIRCVFSFGAPLFTYTQFAGCGGGQILRALRRRPSFTDTGWSSWNQIDSSSEKRLVDCRPFDQALRAGHVRIRLALTKLTAAFFWSWWCPAAVVSVIAAMSWRGCSTANTGHVLIVYYSCRAVVARELFIWWGLK